LSSKVSQTLGGRQGAGNKIQDIDQSQFIITKFATGEILRKPVEVVKGRILDGWAQKSPEPSEEDKVPGTKYRILTGPNSWQQVCNWWNLEKTGGSCEGADFSWLTSRVSRTLGGRQRAVNKIQDVDRSKFMTTKFATGEILRKPVEVVKGRILDGWAQKSPEPWEEDKVPGTKYKILTGPNWWQQSLQPVKSWEKWWKLWRGGF
jgi:hypothetical protein